ncbi:MAG: TIGR03936 family radical SAM-associated protein [Treponema sp.]|nr:TIGR03936 family radical SAM-associated protein [Treponema sp.]
MPESIEYIDPISELGSLLLNIDKPARYTGGEVGRLAKKGCNFNTVIAFPDLYEIGMGNQAMRIIYNRMNSIQGISCERAFAPAPDFEKLLRDRNVPLYGLDTGINIASVDLLMFTLGYELGLNGILTMLDVSGIPIHCEDRINLKRPIEHNIYSDMEDDRNLIKFPIIIAGGPAVSNPLPYSPFIDAFWIGEAEAGFFELANDLANLKKAGEGRTELLKKISSHPNVWVKGKEKSKRAIHFDFSKSDGNIVQEAAVYPVPGMKIVHNHGTVEIMRGCPNGCRFCHAGYWYRPCRQKNSEQIISHVTEMVTKGGWQEISLSSLSSGDYSGIDELIENLNQKFAGNHVSFQLPSLKINGFSLSLLEKISVTRKSGLTFAVETPRDLWQMAINKEVSRDSVVAILNEAKKTGWKSAKFYFMVGLPILDLYENEQIVTDGLASEEEEIVSFIEDITHRSRMRFSINIGIYVPKPHTPYQRAVQINSIYAERKIEYIRAKLKPMGHKISSSDSLISWIEGMLSRGDERAGFICEEAWKEGSRLDPWSEFINRDKWFEVLEKHSDYTKSFFSAMNNLPWSCIDSCVTDEYFLNEFNKSKRALRTSSCNEKCNLCGVCIKKAKPKNNTLENNIINEKIKLCGIKVSKKDPSIHRLLFSFSKKDSAVFHGHLSLIEIFSQAFRRSCIPVMYTQGFNPLAKMQFASPLTTGIKAENEIAAVDFYQDKPEGNFKEKLNACLPQGILIKDSEYFLISSGMKKHSLSSLLWGFSYSNNDGNLDYVNQNNEKVYRQDRLDYCRNDPGDKNISLFNLERYEVLARNIVNDKNEWLSYFDVYRFLYQYSV